MTVKLAAAEAKALFARGEPGAPRTARTATPSGAYHTVCTSCLMEFRTRAAEDRHVAPGHNRFALVLELLG